MRILAAFLLLFATAIGAEWWGQWDRSSDPVSGYLVRYGPSSGNKLVSQLVGDTNRVGLLDIPDGIQVYIEVLAIGTNGVFSLPSNEFVVSTNRVDPPTNLRGATNVTRWELITTNIFYWREITEK
jgi:hypothetical protein